MKLASAADDLIGFTIGFHNHGEGPSRGLLCDSENRL